MVSPSALQQRQHRSRRALAHACHACRRHWALQVVEHPSGKVILCRYCSTVRVSIPAQRSPGKA